MWEIQLQGYTRSTVAACTIEMQRTLKCASAGYKKQPFDTFFTLAGVFFICPLSYPPPDTLKRRPYGLGLSC